MFFFIPSVFLPSPFNSLCLRLPSPFLSVSIVRNSIQISSLDLFQLTGACLGAPVDQVYWLPVNCVCSWSSEREMWQLWLFSSSSGSGSGSGATIMCSILVSTLAVLFLSWERGPVGWVDAKYSHILWQLRIRRKETLIAHECMDL